MAILLSVDQYATLVHASGPRHFSGDIRRVSHLAFGNNYPLHIRQDARALGSRLEIIPQDCAGFGFVCKAHPAAHIEIGAGGCNAVDGPIDKQG